MTRPIEQPSRPRRSRRARVVHAGLAAVGLAAALHACSPDAFLGSDAEEMPLPPAAFVKRGLPPPLPADPAQAGAAGPQVRLERVDDTPPALRLRIADAPGAARRWAGAPSCQVVLRLYETDARDGEPAWRSDAAPGVGCDAGTPDWVPVAPALAAEARRFPVAAILGDSLDGGRYYATATVRSGGVARTVNAGDVYLWADTLAPVADRDALRWVVETAVVGAAPPELVAAVTVTNTGRRRVRLVYDACALRLRLHRTPLRLLPVWHAEERPGAPAECTGAPDTVVLAPRESFTPDAFRVIAAVPDILGDSLREGHYYVGAELSLPIAGDVAESGWTRFLGRDETRERVPLDAGVVDLRGGRASLAPERTAGGLTYRADSRLVHGADDADTVRTAIAVTNTGGQRVTTAVLRDCPVLSYAYRDVDVRDAIPMRPAAWSPPTERCTGTTHRFALEPGESWTFHVDIPAERLRALGDGPFHLTAVLRTPDRLITLAAGAVEF